MRKIKNIELNRLSVDEFKSTDKIPISILLDDVRSAHNVGSIFRTADAFLIKKIYLCGITPQPPNKEIHKTALGSTESVDWEYYSSAKELLEKIKKEESSKIIAIEQTDSSKKLKDFPFSKDKHYFFILGNEVFGVSDELLPYLDDCIEIEQFGTKHSLNVSVCGGIIMWKASSYFRS